MTPALDLRRHQQVGDKDHVKNIVTEDCRSLWLRENEPAASRTQLSAGFFDFFVFMYYNVQTALVDAGLLCFSEYRLRR